MRLTYYNINKELRYLDTKSDISTKDYEYDKTLKELKSIKEDNKVKIIVYSILFLLAGFLIGINI